MRPEELTALLDGSPVQAEGMKEAAAGTDAMGVWLTADEASMVRRFDPRAGHAGFFIAAWEKRPSPSNVVVTSPSYEKHA